MKPFDLEKALAGARVVTRDGREVTQLVRFEGGMAYPLVGVFEGSVTHWSADGRISRLRTEHPNDLFLAGEKKEGWIAHRKPADFGDTKNFMRATSGIYARREMVERAISTWDSEGNWTIQKIEWEE